uniref:Uncharacterized protein n=1 Tax=Hyaloperonospora arabidopsidis (strain Emoy2) TaxID=559515 RepID=M4C2S6_HYAAE
MHKNLSYIIEFIGTHSPFDTYTPSRTVKLWKLIEAVYTLLAGAETMVLSHAIHEGYILLRCRSKKCRAGKTSKFGWFVLMLASTRIVYQWSVVVENVEHIHEGALDVSAYPTAWKIGPQTAKTIGAMARSGAAPKVILATVLQSDPNCNLIPRDVFNANAMVREEQLAGRTPMLPDELQTNNILHAYDRDDQGRITKLFLHQVMLPTCKTFPHVMIMDCTYKANR